MMRAVVLGSLILLAGGPLDASDVRFAGPFVIHDVTSPVSVVAADLSGGGKLDLVTANGSRTIQVLRQDPAEREEWEPVSIDAGFGIYMVRSVDLDGNGEEEILAADPATAVYLIPNDRGSLGMPEPLQGARYPRWITVGDWDADGRLDLASASFDRGAVSILKGDGQRGLEPGSEIVLMEPHCVEGTDYDGDGDLDLIVGHGDGGFRHLRGIGDGTFLVEDLATGLVPCGRYAFTGDFNMDSRGDLVLSCQTSASVQVWRAVMGTSNGDGSYTQRMNLATDGIASLAVADLNDDGEQDISLVTAGSRILSVYPGKGNGSFLPEVLFGSTGNSPSSVIARDMDGDGFQDVVSGDMGSSTLTVFWGQEGERFLASGSVIPRGTNSPSAVADLDSDGAPDFFFARSVFPGWMFTSRQASRPHPCRPSVSPWRSPVTI